MFAQKINYRSACLIATLALDIIYTYFDSFKKLLRFPFNHQLTVWAALKDTFMLTIKKCFYSSSFTISQKVNPLKKTFLKVTFGNMNAYCTEIWTYTKPYHLSKPIQLYLLSGLATEFLFLFWNAFLEYFLFNLLW